MCESPSIGCNRTNLWNRHVGAMKRAIFTIGLVILVEATVESAYPVIDRRPLTSDFLIRVNKVVKGNLTSNQIAVHQFGGTLQGGRIAEPMQYSIMVPGERYI